MMGHRRDISSNTNGACLPACSRSPATGRSFDVFSAIQLPSIPHHLRTASAYVSIRTIFRSPQCLPPKLEPGFEGICSSEPGRASAKSLRHGRRRDGPAGEAASDGLTCRHRGAVVVLCARLHPE